MEGIDYVHNFIMSILLSILVVAVFGAFGAYDDPAPAVDSIVKVCEYTRDTMGNLLSERCWEEVR